MPTPTPAKPRSSSGRTQGFGSLIVFVLAVGFAVHLLRAETPAADEPAAPPSELEAELGNDPTAVLRNLTRALPRGEREAQRLKVLEVQALVKNGQVGSARARASDYFERWPNGPDIAALEQLTGAHPNGDAQER